MKKIFYLFLLGFLSTAAWTEPGFTAVQTEAAPLNPFRVAAFISPDEAQKLLGQPVYLKDSSLKSTKVSTTFKFNYRVANDTISFKGLFFAYEEYNDTATAASLFSKFRQENEKMFAVTDYKKAGDEGFLVLDKSNIPSLHIRKGNKTFKLRLYHKPGKKALEQMETLAIKIVSAR